MKTIEPWKLAACLIAVLALLPGCAPREAAEPRAEPQTLEPEARPEEAEPPVPQEELEAGIEEAEPVPPGPMPLPVAEKVTAGKQVFLDQRCDTCHSVSTADIEAKVTSGPTAGSDLAGILERRDRAAVEAIVRQEEPAGEGRKHPRRFTGSQEELDALIDWLAPQG